MDADLGCASPAGGVSRGRRRTVRPRLLAATPAKLDRLEIAAGAAEVSVLLHVPPRCRWTCAAILAAFCWCSARPPARRSRSASREHRSRRRRSVAVAPRPLPAPPAPSPSPAAVVAERGRPCRTRTSARTTPARRRRRPHRRPHHRQPGPRPTPQSWPPALPGHAAEAQAGTGSVTSSTGGCSDRRPEPLRRGVGALPEIVEPGQEAGVAVAPSASAPPGRAIRERRHLRREHRRAVEGPVPRGAARCGGGAGRAGRFTLDYAPVFRAFATYDDVTAAATRSWRHRPPRRQPGDAARRDRFRAAPSTPVVDPGEYFFGLGHFQRNDRRGREHHGRTR